jgi:hypothetical protein
LTELGATVQFAPISNGKAEQVNATVLLEALRGAMANVALADCPAVTVSDAGLGATEKSGTITLMKLIAPDPW